MSSANDPHSILNRNPELGKFQVPKPKPKVTRYFAGKAPEWQKEDSDDEDIFPGEFDLKSMGGTSITSEKMNQRLAVLEEVANKKKPEERVVARSEKLNEVKAEVQKNLALHKTRLEQVKEVVQNAKLDEKGVKMVGNTEGEDRRAALKARLLAREEGLSSKEIVNNEEKDKKVENIEKMEEEEEEIGLSEGEDEEGDNEEEDEENEGGIINILKPIYVKKNERSSLAMSDKQVVSPQKPSFFLKIFFQLEEIALEEERKKMIERKKIEAKIIVSDAVKRTNDDDEEAEKSNSEQGIPEDNDDIEQDQEVF